MISLERVKKQYSAGENVIHAVDDVNLEVADGDFLILTGHSGSGKTTLLNIIGGMTRPDQGRVIVCGKDLLGMPDAELSRFRGRSIGFVFQFQSMLPTLNALDNIRLPLSLAGKSDDKDKALSLLAKVGLSERAGAYVHELSAGQQRRVCLARAFINQPALLLCDEPTGDLDPDTEAEIMKLIADAHKQGTTVLMTTHNMELKSFGSRNLNIKQGRLIEE